HEDMEMARLAITGKFCVPFLFFRRPQWDKFPGADDTFAADTLMPDGKVLQLPSTHLLGQNFSKPFNIKFLDEIGESQYAYQTCYGPAISRIYAAVISVNGDDKGLVLPSCLAPTTVMIVPIYKKGGEEAVLAKCATVEKTLMAAGIKCGIDKSESTPGFKFNHWELKGIPVRVEIGGREAESGELTIAIRDTGEKSKIQESKLVLEIPRLLSEMDKRLAAKANAGFEGKIRDAKTMDDLNKALETGGFARAPWCSTGFDGKPCADGIKAKTTGDVRGTLFGKDEKPEAGAVCIHCGKSAKEVVYLARQY
ncbi:MAG TPA: His/Gly/Thr/Pro-type tRNA ligase C-terminal domain-containing protein, partial [Candidatus Micrarchaeota archaeon]|nr:His/Gly/Thr/Pro-type tRNA ligase C-terminal domain-containing protein [Candidatus Micrarchaeota archaeon]